MKQTIYQHRNGLHRVLNKLQEGYVSVGFIGGSITDGRVKHNWPESVMNWFVEQYPQVKFTVENAAIGATGSDLGVFRAQRDLINRNCDLVFIEFAVNDFGSAAERRSRTREGLIRKLLAGQGRDLVIVYTYLQEMYKDMIQGDVPASIAEFEQLAEHYGIGSVWMGLHSLEEVKKGRMRWEEWLPDGLHPTHRGSLSYGQSVIKFLQQELITAPSVGLILVGDGRPAPLNSRNWEHTEFIPLTEVELEGPWLLRRWANVEWIDQVLDTAAVGARLKFSFEGRGVSLGFDYGLNSAEYRYKVDDQEWVASNRVRPNWCGLEGWYVTETISDELEYGRHEVEIEVIHGDTVECKGTDFRLAHIGIIK